jgi:hypothetical protein
MSSKTHEGSALLLLLLLSTLSSKTPISTPAPVRRAALAALFSLSQSDTRWTKGVVGGEGDAAVGWCVDNTGCCCGCCGAGCSG